MTADKFRSIGEIAQTILDGVLARHIQRASKLEKPTSAATPHPADVSCLPPAGALVY